MTRLTVRLLRFSLLGLAAGSLLGAWRLAELPLRADWIPRLRAAHIQLMLFGWLIPFVLGVGYWMLPRHPAGEYPRGSPGLARSAVWLILLGVTGGVIATLAGLKAAGVVGQAMAVAGTAVLAGMLVPRVRATFASRS